MGITALGLLQSLTESTSFLWLIGIVTLLFGAILAIHGMLHSGRQAILQAGALILVIAVMVLANDRWVYVVAVFVFASFFVSHRFLHTLAAVFRGGNRPFFDYLSEIDKRANTRTEIAQQTSVAAPVVEEENLIDASMRAQRRVIDAYKENFPFFPMLRDIRLTDHPDMQLDAVVSTSTYDLLLEIKYVAAMDAMASLLPNWIARFRDTARTYRQSSGKSVLPRLVLVTTADSNARAKVEASIKGLLENADPVVDLQWLDADEYLSD